MSDVCMVFFRCGACDLEAAALAMEGSGLKVQRDGATLVVGRDGSPSFRIGHVTDSHVQVEAAEIGAGSEHEEAMRGCDARFEIEIQDLDEALDEANTLMEVQGALQDACQGYLFLPWNGSLSEPWQG